MSSLDAKRKAGNGETGMLATGVVLVLGVPSILWAIATLGHALAPRPDGLPDGFWPTALGMFTGTLAWRWTEILLMALLAALIVALLAWAALISHRRNKNRVRHDRAARYMASLKDVAPFTPTEVQKKADRFGVEAPGVMLGKMVRTGTPLYASWEDTLLHIWGTRTGKTTSQAAPSIIEAPGPVIATSNKRDLSDLTRDIRAKEGEVWVFDPQGVAGEKPTWWWNPLTYVTDSERASEMANNFALGSRAAGAKSGDAYFDSAGKDLLAGLLLAAAVGGEPIDRVHHWLTRPADDQAVQHLRDAGWRKEADAVAGALNAPDKQREGIYGTARQMASCLKNEKIAPWVNPSGPRDARPQFQPEEFARGKNTLYALSKEGAGTAGPLVTSLTVATVTAAEEYAVTQRGGRLATPMLCVLDEAANVCRWANLPDLYSHYGSRGIVVSTFLQSWSQGVDVWNESGMKKLFSTANVFTYGGNVKEESFLKMLSELVGQYQYTAVSQSRQKDGRSTSRQDSREEILSVADLASLPRGRAVMLGSGARAALLRTVPINARPYAAESAASAEAHDPSKLQQHPVASIEAASANRWSLLAKDS